MRPMNRSLLAVVLTLLAFPAWIGAQESTDPTEDLGEALELVDRAMKSGRWARAKEQLLAAVEANKDRPVVLHRAQEIQDMMRTCAFWLTHEAPDPKDCVSGELASYGGPTGRIELRYFNRADGRRQKPVPAAASKAKHKHVSRFSGYDFSDFVAVGNLRFHPMLFDGPFKIELEGQGPPPVVLVCADWERAYAVVLRGAGARRDPASVHVLRIEGGNATELAAGPAPAVQVGRYELEVSVATSSIQVHVQGEKLLTAKKESGEWGAFGFEHTETVGRVTIRGDAQPSFMQGAIDAAMQKDRADFEARYSPAADLPAWFVKKTAAREAADLGSADELPGVEDPKQFAHVQRVRELFGSDVPSVEAVERELEHVRALAPAEITDPLRSWLSALLLASLGEHEQALDECRRTRTSDPQFLPARLFSARLHDDLGQRETALQVCRELVAEEPLRAEGHDRLAQLLLADGRLADARAAVHAAIDAGVPANELFRVTRVLLRGEKGPSWPRTFAHQSQHFDVRSDINEHVCVRAAKLLEKFYEKFNAQIRRVAGSGGRRYPVYLFSGEAGYHAYTNELIGGRAEHTAGLYAPALKQLLIWNLPDIEETLRTVRHEGFHQYFDELVPGEPPVWLDEGLAQYYEGSELVGGVWKHGQKLPARVQTLRRAPPRPLKTFLRTKRAAFLHEASVGANYAQAWAFVCFLLDGNSAHRRRLDALIDALASGKDSDASLDVAFGDADFEQLDIEFARYIREKLL